MGETTGRVRGTTRELEQVALDLRQRLTWAERVLWNALRANRLADLPFRRQHPLGPFVVDFACPERLLIVEVDGDIHLDQVEQDASRTELLTSYGWHLIRFRNEEVLHNLSSVLNHIQSIAESLPVAPARHSTSATSRLSLPSPRLGRGAGGEGQSSHPNAATNQKGHHQ